MAEKMCMYDHGFVRYMQLHHVEKEPMTKGKKLQNYKIQRIKKNMREFLPTNSRIKPSFGQSISRASLKLLSGIGLCNKKGLRERSFKKQGIDWVKLSGESKCRTQVEQLPGLTLFEFGEGNTV